MKANRVHMCVQQWGSRVRAAGERVCPSPYVCVGVEEWGVCGSLSVRVSSQEELLGRLCQASVFLAGSSPTHPA